MKRITLLLLVLFAFSAQKNAFSDIVTTVGSAASTGNVGTEVNIPITATPSMSTDIYSMDLYIDYDPTITTITSVTEGALFPSGFSAAIDNVTGRVNLKYFGFGGFVTLSSPNTVICTIKFRKVGNGTQPLVISEPAGSAYFDINGDAILPSTYIAGSLEFQGDAPHTIAPAIEACSGPGIISVPVIVNDFTTIGAVSLQLQYSTSVLTYAGSPTIAPGFILSIDGTTTPGMVFISGFSGGVTYPDGTTLFTLKFTYSGGYTDLAWIDDGGSCQYANQQATALPDTPFANYYTNGSVGPAPSTWTGASGTAWDNLANWSCDVPTAYTDVIIDAVTNYPVISTAANVKSLTINAGSVTIGPSGSLTVANTLTNNMGNAGLVIKSDATGTGSLIHSSANVNATVERYISGSSNLSANLYHQVSVPLAQSSNPTSNLFLDSYLFDFTESGSTSGEWNPLGVSTTTPLDVNRGYLIYYPNASHLYTFAGPLRAGTVSPTIGFTDAAHGFNLVPNPYPSAIDWTLLTKSNLADAIWIWNSAYQNYGAYGSQTGGGTSATSQYIPVGQSFFVRATASSPVLAIENADRVHNTQAFLKNTKTIENQLHLAVDANNSRDEIMVAFGDNWSAATEAADVTKMYGNDGAPQLSTVASDGSKLSIDARAFAGNDVIVPLNFTLTTSADVTFTATGTETFTLGNPIYLEDMVLNTLTDLRNNPVYTFNHTEGSDNDRFRLVFKSSTGINNPDATVWGKLFVSQGMLNIVLNNKQQTEVTIAIYDATGRQLSSKKEVISGLYQMAAPEAPGMYIVLVSGSDKTFTGKVVVN